MSRSPRSGPTPSVLQGVYRRGNTVQIVRAQLTSPAALQTLRKALEQDPRAQRLGAQRTAPSTPTSRASCSALIKYVGTTIAILMGIGAVFAALNTMYSAVSSRTREIATLRALGFGAAPVVTSVLLESAVLGLLGGVVGGAAGVLRPRTATRRRRSNCGSFSQLTFAFTVTPRLLVTGLWYALILGHRRAACCLESGRRECR